MKLNNLLNKINLKKVSLKEYSIKATLKDKRSRPILILKFLSYFIILFLISAVMFTVFFVYTSITNSIGQIQSIVSFQSEAHVQLIEFNKLEKIEKYWQEKVMSQLPTINRNPFTEQLLLENTGTDTTTEITATNSL